MIDLHCHILPGVDDGAHDLADSLAMGRQAAADGIELICATPHIRDDHDVVITELADRVTALEGELAGSGLAVKVRSGGEVAQAEVDRLTSEELRAVSLCGTGKWILLEPAPGPLDAGLLEAVDRLESAGAQAVVAHPERHLSDDAIAVLEALVARGSLIQVTAAAVEHEGSAGTIAALAETGLVHLVASDAHSSHIGRPVRLSAAVNRLREVERLRPHLEWVTRRAPEAIVRGEPVEPPWL